MEAGQLVDAFGLREGSMIQQFDAAQAYLQAELRGKPVRVFRPLGQWPPTWEGIGRPISRLRVPRYGHPDRGVGWEHPCDPSLPPVGFGKVGQGVRPSCYHHKTRNFLLSECADDLNKSGQSRTWPRVGE